MNTRAVEVSVGIFILLALLGLVFLAFRVTDVSHLNFDKTYSVTAEFSDVGDLKDDAPVRIGGVKVGTISKITLDPQTFQAQVTMTLSDGVKNLPVDTSASIYTQGLLGASFVSLTPGFSEQSLKNGSALQTTHSAMILEKVIGQLIYGLKDKPKEG